MVTTGDAASTCGTCGGPVPATATGRPRQYCRPACRQAAYRARQAGKQPAVQDADHARELARVLTDAGRTLARAVTSPAAGNEAAWQAAADHATAALAALATLAGVPIPASDKTPAPVTKPAAHAHAAPARRPAGTRPAAVATWMRSADRSTWVADIGGAALAVTRSGDGTWRPAVRRPGHHEVAGPPRRTRLQAQRWAESEAATLDPHQLQRHCVSWWCWLSRRG
jgi:hypothetical protein